MTVYVNPLAHADITAAERIDQGVDYGVAGGYLAAIGRCKILDNAPGGWGVYGNFVSYVLLDPGPLEGAMVYYAEGVTSGRNSGDILEPGNGVCMLIPYWHSGIEIGWYSGHPYTSWANYYGGGYSEGDCTRSGLSFNSVLTKLGAPGGSIQGPIVGTAPPWSLSGGGYTPGVPGPGPAPVIDSEQIVSTLDPSGEVKDIADQWSINGSRAYNHANDIGDLFQRTSYVDESGPR